MIFCLIFKVYGGDLVPISGAHYPTIRNKYFKFLFWMSGAAFNAIYREETVAVAFYSV